MAPVRLSCSTLPLWRPLSLGPLTHSPFAGVSSRALFVSAHFMCHMLASPLTHASNSGARLQLQSIVSQLHISIPLLLAGDSHICFPFPQLGRSRQTDAPLLPIVQQILQSHSLSSLWWLSGHHSLKTFSPRLRLFTCASLLPSFLRPHACHHSCCSQRLLSCFRRSGSPALGTLCFQIVVAQLNMQQKYCSMEQPEIRPTEMV